MKKSTYAIIVFLLATIIISCKKEAAISITGYWPGSGMNDGSGSTTAPIDLLFRDGGEVRAYLLSADTATAAKGVGTYSIDPDSVRAIVALSPTVSISFHGKLNTANNQMTGRFMNLSNGTSGNFTVIKN